VKTQVLNTVFTGNAGPLQGEVNKLVGSVNMSMSSILSRAQALANIRATTGMRPADVQATKRMEETLGIPGLGGAMARIAQQRQWKQEAGVEAGLSRMGVPSKDFWGATSAQRAAMISEGLAKDKDLQSRMITASMLGNRDVFLAAAERAQGKPSQARLAAVMADKYAPGKDELYNKRVEIAAANVKTVTGIVGDEVKRMVTGETPHTAYYQAKRIIGEQFNPPPLPAGEMTWPKYPGAVPDGAPKQTVENPMVKIFQDMKDNLDGIHRHTKNLE